MEKSDYFQAHVKFQIFPIIQTYFRQYQSLLLFYFAESGLVIQVDGIKDFQLDHKNRQARPGTYYVFNQKY